MVCVDDIEKCGAGKAKWKDEEAGKNENVVVYLRDNQVREKEKKKLSRVLLHMTLPGIFTISLCYIYRAISNLKVILIQKLSKKQG